jgi:hypothetical protein
MSRIEVISMSQSEKRDPSVRALGLMVGAVALWGTTYAVAARILHHPGASAKLRAAAVVIATLGFIPYPLATAKLIRMHYEFTRRVHLIALAIAFVATALFIFVADLLWRAGFVDYVSLMTIWLVMLGVWWVALAGTSWYYLR